MKVLKQIFLFAFIMAGLTLAVSAQKDDRQRPPKEKPPVIQPGEKKVPPPPKDDKKKPPGMVSLRVPKEDTDQA
ncbi:MAG: hypothetical protein ACR2IH_05105 [Pyrinomonadaceae bacterium]